MSLQRNYSGVPQYEGQELTEEHKRLKALFDEMRKGQVEFLDQAGKRIIELSTGLLGVLFAVTAFGDKFPPPYLTADPLVRWLALFVLIFLVLALLCGVFTVQPRTYDDWGQNLSEMRNELARIIAYKSSWHKRGAWLFFVGTLLLAGLIALLILTA